MALSIRLISMRVSSEGSPGSRSSSSSSGSARSSVTPAARASGQQASSGHLFVFCNASRTRVRILYFDGTGLWLLTKRLERGRFAWPAAALDADPAVPRRMTLSHSELLMLLSGIDLAGTTRRSWWRKEQAPLKAAADTRNGYCSHASGSVE